MKYRIKEFREKNHQTIRQIAEIADVSYQAVHQWENETDSPKIIYLCRLAAHWGVPVDELIIKEGGGSIERSGSSKERC